tara:strand:+ start:3041 stop:3655 length:615 start_codon:yes stop_codon:yes gene_type:complete
VCSNAYNNKYRKNNREKVNAYGRKHYQNNREKRNASSKKWQQNNREKVNASTRKSHQRPEAKKRRRARQKRPGYKKRRNARRRERYRTDPLYRIKTILRSRLRHALKGKIKSAKTIKLLGCSYSHAQNHLEKQFLPGMTWENHGTWHVDHMMPCASFDLTDPEHQRQCCHYTNLQPMWGKENISKRDKVIYNRVWNGFRWINNA